MMLSLHLPEEKWRQTTGGSQGWSSTELTGRKRCGEQVLWDVQAQPVQGCRQPCGSAQGICCRASVILRKPQLHQGRNQSLTVTWSMREDPV